LYWALLLLGLFAALSLLLWRRLRSARLDLEILLKQSRSIFHNLRQQAPSISAKTPTARSIENELRSLQFRMERTLEHNRATENTAFDSDILELFDTNSDSDKAALVSEHDLFIKLLESIQKRFRTLAAAILYIDGERIEVVSHGLKGQKFQAMIARVYQDYFKSGDSKVFGLKDCLETDSLTVDLALFGCRYYLSYPLNTLANQKGVLWLGYSDLYQPSLPEVEWIRLLAERFEREARSGEKMLKVFKEVREARTSTQAQSNFIASMSHDIRTPLNNIKNILSLLKLDTVASENIELLDGALDNCDQMNSLVETILDYSRHQLGRLDARLRPTELNQALEQLSDSFIATAQLKKIKLSFIPSANECWVMVDPRHLRRIVSNLLSNAIKYTHSGYVQLSIAAGHRSSIIVSDTGVGMSEVELSKLFTPFTRFKPDSAEGVGLGLALTKIMLDLNKAQINVHSKPDQGSRFEISFESIKQPGKIDQASSPGPSLQPGKFTEQVPTTARVLIVDDDSAAAKSMSRLLEREGFQCALAYSVNEALGLVRMSHFDLLISDLNMPAGGFEALLVKLKELGSILPTIVVSGTDQASEIERLLKQGVRSVLSKPFELSELLSEIRRVV
jgi:signal transduction histidine kinase/CheY-like chemotaxis protein